MPVCVMDSENIEVKKPLPAGVACGEELGTMEANCLSPSLLPVGPGTNFYFSEHAPSPLLDFGIL